MSEFYDAGVPACPSCGRADEVRGVPAVYRAGIDRVAARVPGSGDEPARTEQRTVTSTLAQGLALAPAAARVAWGCLGVPLLLAGVGGYIGAIAAGHWRESVSVPFACQEGDPCPPDPSGPDYLPHGTYAWLGWAAVLAFAAGVTLLVSAIVLAGAFRRRLAAGRPGAEAVWSRGWYCARCGTVHFRPAPDLPAGPLQLSEFRRIVWSAGGYGDLSAKHPTP
jgi:hypothetical protein